MPGGRRWEGGIFSAKENMGVDDRFQLESARPPTGGHVLAQGRPDSYEPLSHLVEISFSRKEQND